jgi:hypothetical protein
VKPTPGRELSGMWDHCDTYKSPDGESTTYICICKICGSSMKNENLRASVVNQHFETRSTSDHAHSVVLKLVTRTGNQSQFKLAVSKPEKVPAVVDWLTDALVPPNALQHPSWTTYMKSLDPSYTKPSYEVIYKELHHQVERRKLSVIQAIAEERKANNGSWQHFHYELDMWDEGYTKRHYMGMLLHFINHEFKMCTHCV